MLKYQFRKIWTLLSVYYAYMLEYRAELYFWVLSNSLPIILMGVWVQAGQQGQFDLTPTEFIRYFLGVFIVRQFTVVWVIWEFEREVVEGRLSFRLLQPLDPVWHHVAGHVSERLARFPFAAGLIILCFVLYPDALWYPSVWQILGFILWCAIAFALRFLMQYTWALFAFWTERATALEQFSLLFYLFLSGMIAPLEVFPPFLKQLALLTPFPYMVHFPAAFLMGLPVNIIQGVIVTLVWGALFFVLNRWLWRRGLKEYSGMGA
ncbi:MAG: multidrug ABC transporter permease [Cyanobacteria bacterium]|jgi:ABC-2 type transport system permease protein|nr:multidrug ABC transporter permease [Cyanobacteria bacterium GSL.Bin1]